MPPAQTPTLRYPHALREASVGPRPLGTPALGLTRTHRVQTRVRPGRKDLRRCLRRPAPITRLTRPLLGAACRPPETEIRTTRRVAGGKQETEERGPRRDDFQGRAGNRLPIGCERPRPRPRSSAARRAQSPAPHTVATPRRPPAHALDCQRRRRPRAHRGGLALQRLPPRPHHPPYWGWRSRPGPR